MVDTTLPHVGNKLRSIYDEMRSRQVAAIQKAGALRSDPFFVPDARLNAASVPADALSGSTQVDDRRCLAVSSILDSKAKCHWTGAFTELTKRLHNEFDEYGLTFSQTPNAVGGGQLHWTLMQLVGFPDYETHVIDQENDATPYLSPLYLDCIQDSLTVCGLDTAIEITYIGVVVVSTGLLMVGVPSLDINEARDAVRSRLKDRGLPLLEPFLNDIVHSTLYRVAGHADDMPEGLHLKLMDLAKEFQNEILGKVVLDRFQIGPASWRVLEAEMAATPPLRKWTLPSQSPRERFDETVKTQEQGQGRGCFTVSGASGAKLAKELRLVLSKKNVQEENNKAQEAPKSPSCRQDPPSPPALVLEGLQNVPSAVLQRLDSTRVHDSVPQAANPLEESSCATVSGAAGLALALELQKKLQEEKRAVDRMYYTDFY